MTAIIERIDRAKTWVGVLSILTIGAVLTLIGFALGITYCEYRRVSEFNQMATIANGVVKFGEQCVSSLNDVTRAAIVTTRVQRTYRQAP